jgi:pimeloyl-ACP methyl ester carboxylesterase
LNAVAAAALVALLAAPGCRCNPRSETVGTASASASAQRPPPPKKLPPLHAESWLIELPLEGFGTTSVTVPLGATGPRPILIALHGAGDRPEWQCGTWRGISDNRGFVVCPRGIPHPGFPPSAPRYTWSDVATTESELKAALKALKVRFGEHVAPGSVVLTGFSLGASHASRLLRQEPGFFSRVVLVEGGARDFSATLGTVFAKNGGKKLLFVCTQPGCKPAAQTAVRLVERGGAEAELLDAGNLGHVLDGRAAALIKPRFQALVASDPRWSPPNN